MLGSEAANLVLSDDVSTLPPANVPDSLDRQAEQLALMATRFVAAYRIEGEASPLAKAGLARAHHLLELLEAELNAKNGPTVLSIADDGTWFETTSGRVDVARRGAIKRILRGLAELRQEQPGATMSVDALFDIGWPGERIPYESQVRRVYTAIWTLRTLGLEGQLLTRDEGYLLDPKLALKLVA